MSNGTQTDFTVDEKFMPATEDASTELFEGIDEVYFLEIGFKAVNHELEKLSDTLFETEDLQKEIFKLKKQMQLVSRKITSFVAKNSLEFNKNVENLDVIQKEAEALLNLIKQLRRLVNYCRKKCQASSIVLAIEFKRQKMFKIKEEIVNIQKLYKTEFKLKELIEEGSIFTFVQLAVETIIEINKYIEYSSIKQLSANVLAVLKKEILKIDKLLEEQVCSFQLKYYFYIYSVYELIGNLEETSRKLQSYFKLAFQNSSQTSLALICMDSMENNQSMDDQINYLELCKFVNQKSFTRALIEVGNSLVNILANYHLILKFHIEEDKKKAISNENDSEISECFDAQIIDIGVLQKSMLDNLFQIFDYSATFYNDLLSSMDLEHLKIDQFIRIMEISERFRLFGQRHFGNSCSLIALTLENKSKSFFAHYHLERIDEIHMFLESETFTLCPVSVQFTLFDLPEFYFLKRTNLVELDVPIAENYLQANCYELDRQMDFVLIENSTTFDVFPTLEQINSSPSHSCDSKFSNSLSCDSPEDELDSIQILQNKSMPNLCNTALNILRIIGKYLRMAKILKSTAEQVFDAILQLFYYFVYSLYKYFCLDVQIQQQQQDFGTIFASLRLRQLMDNVQNTYFCQTNGDSITDEQIHHLPAIPNLSPDLNNNEALFSLAERLIGVESTTFLSKQMELLRPALETLVIDKKRGHDLENFFNTLPATSDLLEATLGCVAAKALQSAQILQQISLIDWNIGEIPSEHSNYVYSILKEFESSKEILCKLSVYVHISEEVNFMIWSMMSMCTVRLLVRGYSESNKCSNEGRALQLMDVEHLFKKLEELIGLRPFPHRLYVENYVKAFFLPSDELNEWIVRHTEYTLSQTGALLNASISNAPSATKKAVTMSRIMVNLLDASGISDGSNSFFH